MIRQSERRSAPTVVLGMLSAAGIFVFAFWLAPAFFHGPTAVMGVTLRLHPGKAPPSG